MGGIFSSSSSPTPSSSTSASSKPAAPAMSSTDRAVLDLKVSRDKLKRYKQKLEKEQNDITNRARVLLRAGKKTEALTLLKVKKYKDKQCAQVEGQLDNVNKTLSSVLSAEMTAKVFGALEQGTLALKRLNEEMPMERVEALMDDTAEAIAYQQEVATLLAGGLTSVDVKDVDDELEEMAAELRGGGKMMDLPDAPRGEVKQPARPEPVKEERTLVAS